MPVSVTNEAKNSAVVTGAYKYDVAVWDDSIVTWDALLFSWNSQGVSPTNEAKTPQINTTEPTSPGTAINTDAGGGIATDPWVNVNNALTQDDTYTSCAPSSNLDNSDFLDLTNFGFTIPTNATITGVLVEYDVYASGAGIKDDVIQLIKGGTAQGEDKSTLTDFPLSDTDTYLSKGGSSDMWSLALTPADVNASDFGVRFQIYRQSATSKTGYIDHVRITITYTTPLPSITNQAKS